MRYQWRKKAEKQVESATRYCGKQFGKSVASRFIDSIEHSVNLLVTNPHLGPVEPLLEGRRHNYRSLVVHEHFKLVYYIDTKKDTIYIVSLWDTRRAPTKLSNTL